MPKTHSNFIKNTWTQCRKESIFYVLLGMISVALKMLFAFLVSEIINSVANLDLTRIKQMFLQLIVFLVFRFITSIMLNRLGFRFTEKARSKIKGDVYSHLLNIPLHKNTKIESYENLIITNADMIVEDYFRAILDIVEDCLTLIVAIVILIKVNVFIAVNILFFALVQLLLPKLFQARINKSRQIFSNTTKKQFLFIAELFSIKRLFYSESLRKEKKAECANITEEYQQSSFEKSRSVSDLRVITFVCSQFMYLSTMMVGVFLASKGMLSIGLVVAASQFMNYVTSPLSTILTGVGQVRASSVARNEISNFLDIDQDEFSNIFSEKKQGAGENAININNVSLCTDDNRSILSNINIQISEGEKIIVIGESGSGKTSLAKILTKEILPTNGSIFICGNDITEISDYALHNFISYISSDTLKFTGTTIDNTTLFGDDTSNVAASILNDLDIQSEKLISTCSLGEIQRVQVARSLFEHRPIIIADECTAHLDSSNRKKIEDILLKKANTLIYIAHNYDENLITRFDRVITLSNGSLLEQI